MRGKTVISESLTAQCSGTWGGTKASLFLLLRALVISGVLGIGISLTAWAAEGESSEHFFENLEISLEGEKIPQKLTFPLYKQNNFQYFSAGLGKEERQLSYPPYPLKLIFVKGERAYLTSVMVEILQADGSNVISIPSDEIQGPWLFLDGPPGKYIVKATDSRGQTLEKSIHLTQDTTQKIHFRWSP